VTQLDVIRLLIILIAGVDTYLFLRYRNGPPVRVQVLVIGALAWIVPVMAFFILRFLYRDPVVMNYLSSIIYLVGVSSWLGIGLFIARGNRGTVS
jgi:hypothetical protein